VGVLLVREGDGGDVAFALEVELAFNAELAVLKADTSVVDAHHNVLVHHCHHVEGVALALAPGVALDHGLVLLVLVGEVDDLEDGPLVLLVLEVTELVFVPNDDPALGGAADGPVDKFALFLLELALILVVIDFRIEGDEAGHGDGLRIALADVFGVHVDDRQLRLHVPVPEDALLGVVGYQLLGVVLVEAHIELAHQLLVVDFASDDGQVLRAL